MLRKRDRTLLDDEIDRVLRVLNQHVVCSPEYHKTMAVLVQLKGIREEEKSRPMSKDTMATVAANLLGIFMIIKHEHVNVITSRAMNMLLQLKIKS